MFRPVFPKGLSAVARGRVADPSCPAIRRAAIFLAGCLMAGGAAEGAVVNGTFDAGLESWSTDGALFSTGAQGVITDQTKRRALLWQVVTLTPGLYELSFDVRTNLARELQPGTLPDVFFASLFTALDPVFDPVAPGGFTAVLPIVDMDYRGVTALGSGAATAPSPKGPVYLRVTMAFAAEAGSVAPVFEVNDLNFAPSDSVAAIDNVTIILVPEPSGAFLALFASGAACGWRRRHARA